MKSPVKKIYITQKFGVNKDAYSKFGLQGHNGIDLRAFLPDGGRCYEGEKSEVFTPHDGVVIENAFSATGYGYYVKIENDKEGSVLAHLSSQSKLKLGQVIKEGDFVGYQGTTGNSTGIHLHWGYYSKPRNRDNGFDGFINQEGLYQPYGENMTTDQVTLDKATFEKLVTNSSKYDAFVAAGYPTVEMVNQIISDYKRDNEALRNERDTAKTSLEERRREWLDLIAFLASELGTRQDVQEIKDVAEKYDQVISDAEKVADNYSRDKLSWAVTEQELQGEIARLKALLNQQNILENTKLEELLREIVKRLISIIKK